VLQQPVHRGRALTESDTAGALPVAVVNETFERRTASGGPWLQVVVGVLSGGIVALFSARVIRASLFGIGPPDPLTFVFAIVTVVVAAFAASFAPAMRAVRVDPVRVIVAE
jgi:hypothetical protein